MKLVPETLGDHVRKHMIEKYGSLGKGAVALEMSAAYLSLITCGHKGPSKKVLDDMGWERVVVYRPKFGSGVGVTE